MSRIELKIASTPEQVALASRCIVALCRGIVAAEHVHEIELAACEALNNAVEHAYRMRLDGIIVVEWEVDSHGLNIRVHDWGESLPAECLDRALPDIDPADLDSLPEGGYGLGLLNALMDRVDYRTGEDGRNTLSLFRRFEPAPGPRQDAGMPGPGDR